METSSSTAIPVTTVHSGAVVQDTIAHVAGRASNIVTLSTVAATLPATAPEPELVETTGGALYFKLYSPLDTGGIRIIGFRVWYDGDEVSRSFPIPRSNFSSLLD